MTNSHSDVLMEEYIDINLIANSPRKQVWACEAVGQDDEGCPSVEHIDSINGLQ